ncbi:MAG: LacI family transcriptional regulator, partial [Armatimonadetes bacterium]|nr:LacI family transcriptional regulator [Armatimonadota bacterium]
MRRKAPTIWEVAEAAGVSISTVSNVLYGKRGFYSAETAQRVWEAVKRLGYRPNRIARSLAARRTHTIGIVIEPQHAMFTRNPYVTAVLDGVVELLTPNGYHLKI